MRIVIAAIGRFKPGPERDLFERYAGRTGKIARSLGLSGPDHLEFDESRDRSVAVRLRHEAERLLAATPAGARRIVLDERGRLLTSAELAARMADWRDSGETATAFLLGGPDGHGAPVRDGADLTLALGPMTWPHMLARAMLAEQIYRVTTILAGHPYHRE